MADKNGGSPASSSDNADFDATAFLYGGNAAFLDALYARWREDPAAVGPDWAAYFDGLGDGAEDVARAAKGPGFAKRPRPPLPNGDLVAALTTEWPAADETKTLAKKVEARMPGASAEEVRAAALDSIRAIHMVRAYRVRGHLNADLDPLGLQAREDHPELDPASYGFGPDDLDRPIFIDNVLGLETATVREMVALLKRTYCGRIGYEFIHITDPEQKSWFQRRIEGPDKDIAFTPEGKKAILNKLIEAEGFEKFCQVKFLGTKRFGLDGGEALVPAMEQIIKRGGALGVKEIVLGMAHRGRLNVLANVMGKPYRQIFHEFQGGSANPANVQGSGDVKYHLGASSDRAFDGNTVHLSLTANPSHLEAVNPVVLGKARAKQNQNADKVKRASVLPVLLHGDAAFAGQGVVAECFAMSGTKGFRTGGTIHFIINNQIGFTTAPAYARSSPYPSDVALMVQAPIMHVNGDDPEAVVHAAKIAIEFRQRFQKDVIIDMFCYRRFGHNESDEPAFTQPLMYRAIKAHPTTLKVYADRLVEEGTLARAEVDTMLGDFQARLDSELEEAGAHRPDRADWLDGRWSGMTLPDAGDRRGETSVPLERLKALGETLTTIPDGFNIHRTLARILEQKRQMFETGQGLDWATAEALAFGSLLQEGYPVRLSGQDCSRGTFSQRHAHWVDQESEERYVPLAHVAAGQPDIEIVDSLLSEYAVLGFEYGVSLAEPHALVLWEAQFGDFANGAQVMIDQFIASGEMKWLRMSGLVLLLPHGYEGQGPEHSSARLERFLQLCAEDNMQVAYCTTPANYFHVLRRQVLRNFRKPLIMMTPKSMLRHKRVISRLDEFGPGSSFHRVLYDDAEMLPGATLALRPDPEIARVVICSGKVYYDLMEEREKRGRDDIYIVRLEQLHPFPHAPLADLLRRFAQAEMVWCQEEPKNQGAWTFAQPHLEHVLERIEARTRRPRYCGRPESASPATGLYSQHMAELSALLSDALSH